MSWTIDHPLSITENYISIYIYCLFSFKWRFFLEFLLLFPCGFRSMLLKTTYSMLTFTNPSHFFSWENYRIGWAGGDNVPKGYWMILVKEFLVYDIFVCSYKNIIQKGVLIICFIIKNGFCKKHLSNINPKITYWKCCYSIGIESLESFYKALVIMSSLQL